MSHDATNWAIKQRGLKPATKLVLWHLCDRHHPDHGCFPRQETLAADTEISRSALNDHLRILEDRKLMRRVQRVDERTGKQLSTRYFFAFEPEFEQLPDVVKPCPDSGHGTESGKQPEPCPENAESRVRIPDTIPVIEPVNEPPGALTRGWEEDFKILWSAWPLGQLPDNQESAEKLFRKLSADDRAKALSGIKTYCQAMRCRHKPSRMITYLRDKLYRDHFDEPEIDSEGRFVCRPGSKEWREWLGSVRRTNGERAVELIVGWKYYKTPTRWPEDYRPPAAVSI
jgi:hypothetical protein